MYDIHNDQLYHHIGALLQARHFSEIRFGRHTETRRSSERFSLPIIRVYLYFRPIFTFVHLLTPFLHSSTPE